VMGEEMVSVPRSALALVLQSSENDAAQDKARPIWAAWWECTEAYVKSRRAAAPVERKQ
jgi:hypothetical protein